MVTAVEGFDGNMTPQAPCNETPLMEFTRLEWERHDLEDKVKKIKARQAELQDEVLTRFEAEMTDKVTCMGRTVYIQKKFFHQVADGKTKTDLYEALKEAGYGDLVKPYAFPQSLDALAKEFENDNDGEVPDELKDVFEIGEKMLIRSRRA